MTPAERLATLGPAAALVDVMAFFDSLPAVGVEEMLGQWRGGEIATGHAFDGVLEPGGWYGKRFTSADEVDPLLFRRPGGSLVAGNPALMPLGLIGRFPRLSKNWFAAALFRASVPLLKTGKSRARLRMTEYRGLVSATMIYDALAINDVFRRVDRDTLIGAMDIRGWPDPFFFTLSRDS